jgi:PAS domain S-box-containing protein
MAVDGVPRSLAVISDVTARNAAEYALVEKEFQLTEAQRLAHIGSWTRRVDGSATWSDEMFRLFGLPDGAAILSPDEAMARVHPDDRATLTRIREAHLHGEPASSSEFRLVLPDGSIRHVLERGELRGTTDGEPYVAGTLQDVTERKLAEQTIRQSEERIRLALSAARMGLWDFDTATGVLLVNPVNPDGPGFLDVVTPITREQFVLAFHPDERARAEDVFSAFASGTVSAFDEEYRLLMPDGSSRWTHSTGKIVERDAAGGAVRIVGVARDITERHGLMEALRLRDRAIESSQSAIAIADLEGRISYVNQAFAAMWDLPTPADAVGRSTASLLHNPESARFIIADMLQRRGPWSGELRAVTAEGRLRDVLASAAFVTDEGNEPIGLVTAFVDITDRKHSEQAVAASLREKEALLKEVHHRVKNNLQVISSLLRLELGRTTEPGVAQVLGEMQNRILSMALLHETLYRSEDLSRVDLSRYLERLVQQVFRAAAPAGGRVTLHVSLGPASVDLEQAVPCGLLITELVSNSLKHGFPDGRAGQVRVMLATTNGETLRLSVQDTGVGLPPDFDTRRSKSLGLVLVSDLARQLRGRLETLDGPGAGFQVTFRPRHAMSIPAEGEQRS